MGDCDPGQRRECLRLVEHSLGQVGVEAYALPLAGAERAGLVPDRVRDSESTEVVDEPCASQHPHLWLRQAETCAGVRDELSNRTCVSERVRRLQVDEIGDRMQGVVELLPGEDEREPGFG